MALEEDYVDAHVVDGMGFRKKARCKESGQAAEAEELGLPGADELKAQDVPVARLSTREDHVGN